MVRLTLKQVVVGAFLAGLLNGSATLAQDAASQPVRHLTSSQAVGPVPSEDSQAPSDEQIRLLRKDLRALRLHLLRPEDELTLQDLFLRSGGITGWVPVLQSIFSF